MNPNGTPANLRPFQRGQSGNPGGKPVGSRNRLSGAFLEALADDFERHGKKAIQRCRVATPSRYLQIVASLLPRELAVETQGPTLAELLAEAHERGKELGPPPLSTRLRELQGMSATAGGPAAPAELKAEVPAQRSPTPVVVAITD